MRLVISFLWSYSSLPPILFTNLCLPQSCTPSPKPSVTVFGTLSSLNQQDEESYQIPRIRKIRTQLFKVQVQCPIQTAMLPDSYQVGLKTKVILKESRIIISPFLPHVLKCLRSFSTIKMKALLESVFVLNSSV